MPSDVFSEAYPVRCEIWPATDKRQVEEYGDRISGISNMRMPGQYEISLNGKVPELLFASGFSVKPGDGVCVLADADEEPDYLILSITPYQPVKLEIERRF